MEAGLKSLVFRSTGCGFEGRCIGRLVMENCFAMFGLIPPQLTAVVEVKNKSAHSTRRVVLGSLSPVLGTQQRQPESRNIQTVGDLDGTQFACVINKAENKSSNTSNLESRVANTVDRLGGRDFLQIFEMMFAARHSAGAHSINTDLEGIRVKLTDVMSLLLCRLCGVCNIRKTNRSVSIIGWDVTLMECGTEESSKAITK
jgi:hypothetical protein